MVCTVSHCFRVGQVPGTFMSIPYPLLSHLWPPQTQVEDFEAAERALRRHGVEYSRFLLPGGLFCDTCMCD